MKRRSKQRQTYISTIFAAMEMTDPRKRADAIFIINKLHVKQRTALLMHEYAKLSINEIADATGVSNWMAEHQLQNARELVKAELDVLEHSANNEFPILHSETALKKAFDNYAGETITTEQVDTVLTPVLESIEEGKFDAKRKTRPILFKGPFTAVAAVAILILGITLFSTPINNGSTISLQEGRIPLAQESEQIFSMENAIYGKVYVAGTNSDDASEIATNLGGIELQLISVDVENQYLQAITEDNGSYEFIGFPDGIYRLRVILPKDGSIEFAVGDQHDESSRTGETATSSIVIVNGNADLEFGEAAIRMLESVDIPIWTVQ